MNLFASRQKAPAAPPSRQKVQDKRDRLRVGASEVKDKSKALSSEVATVRSALHEAVESGDAVAQNELTAKLSRLNADLDANRTLGEITESSLASAEKELADIRDKEHVALVETAIAETEAAWHVARDAVGPAFVAFAEARGREHELAERIAGLRRLYRTLGGDRVVATPDPVETVAQVVTQALASKHGSQVRYINADAAAFGAIVTGLAGPEPRTDPED